MATLSKERHEFLTELYKGYDLKQLAVEFRMKQKWYEDAKAVSADMYAEFEFLRKSILPARMDEMGLTTANIKDVGRIQIAHQLSAKQVDKIALFEWLEANGHGDLIADTVNASSLAAFIKAQIADGEPIPPDDVIGISTYEVASVVKG